MNDLRSLVNQIMQHTPNDHTWEEKQGPIIHELESSGANANQNNNETRFTIQPSAGQPSITVSPIQKHVIVDESLSLTDKEKEFIQKALSKHKGRRKLAAKELGISERTLYRKMNEYGIH